MAKIKISVIKTFSPEDVFGGKVTRPNESSALTPCTKVREGQEFIVDDKGVMPEGFCGWAWRDIYKDLSVLRFEGDFPFTELGVMYTSCTDGMRPVCFKLERLKE